jgi:hypothetical protein
MKFVDMLKRSNIEVQDARANRVAKAVYKSQQRIIDNLDSKRDILLEVIEASQDLSTSNSKDSVNRIDSFEADSWTMKFQANSVALVKVTEELAIARANMTEMFDMELVDLETGEVLLETKVKSTKRKK